jgi:hypothetical protein
MPSQTLLQRGKKTYRLMMLFEEISECFSGKLWESAAPLLRNGFYRVPDIIIELDSFTVHGLKLIRFTRQR